MIRIFFMTVLTAMLLVYCSDNGTDPVNQPGELVKVEVPDSIKRPPASELNLAVVHAWVSDPDGLSDVDSVYFYSLKPNGEYANGGNPLLLVDNGKPFSITNPLEEAGDAEAGDGIYTLTIFMDAAADTGTYYFTFYMRDKGGYLTDAITDSIEVYQ